MLDQLRKVSDNELERIKLIEACLSKKISLIKVAKQLGISDRQVRRLKVAYLEQGAAGLIHKLRGRTSNRQKNKSIEQKQAMELIKTKYKGYTPTFVFEMLTQIEHSYSLSNEWVRQAMIREGLWIPKRKKKHSIYYHPLRIRRPCEGELVQADGSPDYYLGREFGECCLIVFVDDATGKIFAYLCESEDTLNYFRAMKPYFLKHGIPRAFYVDRFSVFAPPVIKGREYENKTQFYRVCRELDIELILANSPQAKGRVERANSTLQTRLIQMFSHQKFTSFNQANDYLQNFYLDFINTKFAVMPSSKQRVCRYISSKQLDDILVIKDERTLSKNLTCQYEGNIYQLYPNPHQSYLSLLAKGKVQVITDLDNKLHFKIAIPKGQSELRYELKEKLHITPTASRKQVNLYLNKLSESSPTCKIQRNPWEEYF